MFALQHVAEHRHCELGLFKGEEKACSPSTLMVKRKPALAKTLRCLVRGMGLWVRVLL